MKYLKHFENFEDHYSYDDIDAYCINELDENLEDFTGYVTWLVDDEIEELEKIGLVKTETPKSEIIRANIIDNKITYTLEKDREAIETFLELFRTSKKYNL